MSQLSIASSTGLVIPAFVRGRTTYGSLVEHGGRSRRPSFQAPNAADLLPDIPLSDPRALLDLNALAFDEITAYLDELGRRLALDGNDLMAEALELGASWSDLTPPVLRTAYESLPSIFSRASVREIAERSVGIEYLERWVPHPLPDGRPAAVRAFGARSVHIIAGNSPLIAAMTVIRSAITRSDAIVKIPSNDPLTMLAIARTMEAMAPDHPITRHLCVLYWKGGDRAFEDGLYQPHVVEKIVAWGGMHSLMHVRQYLQPGLELIALDPKLSATIIGADAFTDDANLPEVAARAALDVGAMNQIACANARVIYAQTGTDEVGLDRARVFGTMLYNELQRLPEQISTPAAHLDEELLALVQAVRTTDDGTEVIGGRDGEGAVIVSAVPEPVPFHTRLSGRTVNVVPVDSIDEVLPRITAMTQTVGVYPEELQKQLRDILPLHGTQRVVALGCAASPNLTLPQDAIEPIRRMVKWIVDEGRDIPPISQRGTTAPALNGRPS